jgi:hypothetical protein
MNIKTNVVFSIIAITAAVLLFAADPLVATQQAHAQWGDGWDGGWGWGGGYPYVNCRIFIYSTGPCL